MAVAVVPGSGTPHGDGAAAATTHTITLPSGIQAGEGVMVIASVAAGPTASVHASSSTGWLLVGQSTTGLNHSLAGFVLATAQGGGLDSLVIGLSASQKVTAVSYRITGHDPGRLPWPSVFATGSDANPDPPSLSLPGGTPEEALWIACSASNAAHTYSSAPSGYSEFVSVQGLAAANGQDGVAAAVRVLNAGVEDPAAFTMSDARNWTTAVIAIRPLALAEILGEHSHGVTLGSTASGAVDIVGASSQTVTLSNSAAGAVAVAGGLTGTVVLGGSASGVVGVTGDHTGTITLTHSASGGTEESRNGDHQGAVTLWSIASGETPITGEASHNLVLGLAASGVVEEFTLPEISGGATHTLILTHESQAVTSIPGISYRGRYRDGAQRLMIRPGLLRPRR